MPEAAAPAELALEISRVFQARQDAVFRAWTDREQLANWWGPKGFDAHIDTFDARPGGAYRIDMRSPDGDSHWLRGEFVEIDPHDKLSMTWIWEQGDLAGHEMLVTVEFFGIDDATEVRLTHARLPGEEARTLHNEGWLSSLDCFGELWEGN